MAQKVAGSGPEQNLTSALQDNKRPGSGSAAKQAEEESGVGWGETGTARATLIGKRELAKPRTAPGGRAPAGTSQEQALQVQVRYERHSFALEMHDLQLHSPLTLFRQVFEMPGRCITMLLCLACESVIIM